MALERINQRDVNNNNGPILAQDEALHYTLPKVTLQFAKPSNEGQGTLYVTTKRVVWLHDSSDIGYGIDFHYLMCHAIARDTSGSDLISQPCIYCQLDDDSEEYYEARFIPEDPLLLEKMFQAFSECAALNPDPIEEDEGNFFYNEEEVMGSDAQARLAHLESVFQEPTPEQLQQMHLSAAQQFEDPIEEDSENHQNGHDSPEGPNKKQKNGE